jgi:hypothetical protein
VYTSFREIEIDGEGFDGDIHPGLVDKEVGKVVDELTKGGTIPVILRGENSLLQLLVAAISAGCNIPGTNPASPRVHPKCFDSSRKMQYIY